MIELKAWRDRLTAKLPALLVKGALTGDQHRQASQRTGDAAFLSWQSESGAPSDLIGYSRQVVVAEVSVLLRCTSAAGPDEGLVELEALRRDVRNALLGWQPAGGTEVEFRRGQAVAVESNGVQWWQDIYSTEYLISEQEDTE